MEISRWKLFGIKTLDFFLAIFHFSDLEKMPVASQNGLDPLLIFVSQHENQLESGGVPKHLWNALFSKVCFRF